MKLEISVWEAPETVTDVPDEVAKDLETTLQASLKAGGYGRFHAKLENKGECLRFKSILKTWARNHDPRVHVRLSSRGLAENEVVYSLRLWTDEDTQREIANREAIAAGTRKVGRPKGSKNPTKK